MNGQTPGDRMLAATHEQPRPEGSSQLIGPTHDYPDPLSNPANNFWQTRGARTQEEVDFLQGWKFRPDPNIEAVLWLQQNAPDLVDEVSSEYRLPDVLRTYLAKRTAAVKIGRELSPGALSTEAVEIVRAARGGAALTIDTETRASMLEAMEDGREPFPEWRTGKQRAKDLADMRSRVAGARSALRLRPSGMGVDERSLLGSYMDELANITDTL